MHMDKFLISQLDSQHTNLLQPCSKEKYGLTKGCYAKPYNNLIIIQMFISVAVFICIWI